MNLNQRCAGVLLHITSLPGPHGVGDLGPEAFHFVDWLVDAGQTVWQILPTTPIGPGDSPYQSVSAFAGSPLMVALEPLVAKGWLGSPLLPTDGFGTQRVDFAAVAPWRIGQLRIASDHFFSRAAPADAQDFSSWCSAQAHWLDDHVLFSALEHAHAGAAWWHWPAPQREREPAALAEARRELAGEIRFWQFVQWCFDAQWTALKTYANQRGVRIMGDLPIFIAHHSADCWTRPDLYELDADYQPTVVAGVPPDAFSADGQRWGNPLYRWDRMAAEDYAWWTARVRRALAQTDAFRIDHFRGFAAYWGVPATSPTAVDGHWMPGPGKLFFDALAHALGPLPIVAEDLGVITPDVVALRDGCGFPGMKILQFAFGDDAANPYLPHLHTPSAVVYTGTHDNDTTRGWWDTALPAERAFAGTYLAADGGNIHSAMIRAACNSVANIAITPMQDVLGLDGTHRMNLPGTPTGNWSWRFDWTLVGAEPGRLLGAMTAASGRGPFDKLRAPG
ncbi:MAG: 4-alpha-glucanotransferase [Pseudomonadota bacterium]|nr:4-alpha-glucanotransferase [Pseudomonadota bacterium]